MIPPLSHLSAMIVAIALLLASWVIGRDAGQKACQSEWRAQQLAQAEAHVAALDAANRKADTLAARLAAAETRTRTIYKEVVREIPAVTFDRPCLGADALGLLDRLPAAAAGHLPQATGQPADTAGSVTTDTQIAGWIADVTDQHERERQRCNALIEWHQ